MTEAKKFYTLDNFCSDYIELIQDHSRAYKSLCVFESSEDRRSKMHKRRVDMLEELIGELNPQFYLLVSPSHFVKLNYIATSSFDIKRGQFEMTNQDNVQHTHSINYILPKILIHRNNS